MQGDKLKNPLLNDDSFDQPQDNILFKEEKKNMSFKNIIKRMEKRKISPEKPKSVRSQLKSKIISKVSAKELNNKKFSYKINVNCKVLKYNLVAEKANNKFFSIIFNKLSSEQENLYHKLGIKEPSKNNLKSMTNLRLHMGLNTNTNKLNNKNFIDEKSSNGGKKIRTAIEAVDKNDQQEDIDIFITFKHLKKQGLNSPNNINLENRFQVDKNSGLEKNLSHNSELEGDLSKISEFGKDDADSNNSNFVDDDKSESSYQSSLSNSVIKEFKEKKGINYDENIDLELLKNDTKNLKTKSGEKGNKNHEIEEKLFLRKSHSFQQLDFSHNFTEFYLEKEQIFVLNQSKSLIEIPQKLDIRLKKKDSVKPKHKLSLKGNNRMIDISKKITVNSIFYYEWSRDFSKNITPFYYMSTPLTKFNEINIPVQENPYLLCKSMSIEEFFTIGKFEFDPNMKTCKVFVYDQHTAVPYKINDFSSSPKKNMKKKASLIKHLIKSETPVVSPEKPQRKNKTESPNYRKSNFLVILLNDFFDSFHKYTDSMLASLMGMSTQVDNLRLVSFNFPGQAMTIFPKKTIFNNLYFSEFLDRFLFYLAETNVFDHTYYLMFVGFGNGGHIALTFASCFEKYWDFLHSIILFNCYTENDDFISKSMLEILKIVETSKNPKLVDFFYKSITVNPQKLLDHEDKSFINEKYPMTKDLEKIGRSSIINFDIINPNNITMNGYYSITKGFFYNIKINHGDIKTPLIVVHSNQNCFITINNINSLFKSMKNSNKNENKNTKVIKGSSSQYNYDELNASNSLKRKFIVVDGSHDILIEDQNYVSNVISSYLNYTIINNQIVPKFY